MKNSRIYFALVGAMIILSSCKKDYPQNKTPQEQKWTVTTFAGDGSPAFADGPALLSKFHFPEDIAVTDDGTIYVTDAGNSRIRKIVSGTVSNFAGSNLGFVNGNGALAEFKYPFSIAVDAGGSIYSSDARDARVRKLTTAAEVSTYAGTDEEGFKDGSISLARFGEEIRVVSDAQGNIYVADSQNNRIRKISVSGTVSTIAGSGLSGFRDGSGDQVQFSFPNGIAIDKQGNLYVADGGNYRIRKITPDGSVSTVAGSDKFGFADGDKNTARFEFPTDMVIDNDGNLYVIDISRIRKISPQGIVSTIAGSVEGYIDGDGTVAQFTTPDGLGIDKEGNIYVADTNNNRIRKISLQ